MILQLNPPLKFIHAESGHKLTAYLVIDYSRDEDSIFLCCDETTLEPWWFRQSEMRFDSNITFGRTAIHE